MDPARQALVRKSLIGLAGVTVVAGVGFGLYNSIVDRPPKFARVVAADLPADTVGMLAFAEPSRTLALIEDSVSPQIRGELEQHLGFDPLDEDDWAEFGLDLDAPIGLGITRIERPVFIVSVGLDDADAARRAIRDASDKLHLEWKEREFEGVDGLWLEAAPAAIVFRDERLLMLTSDSHDEQAVIDAAEEVAKLARRDSLAHTTAFRSIHRFEGDAILMGFANVGEVGRMAMSAALFGSTDMQTMAFALTSDGSDIHAIYQTTMAKDAKYLDYMRGRDRSPEALDQVPGPVYAGLHWSLDPQYVLDLLDDIGRFGRDAVDEMEEEGQRELGVSVRNDVIGSWNGEFGLLWTGAGGRGEDEKWGGLLFAGVRDEDEAERLLAQVWSHTDGLDKQNTSTGTVYTWDERPELAAKVYDGRIWFGAGHSRIDEVDDDAKGFRKTTKADAIADLVTSGSSGIAFFDLVEIRSVLADEIDDEPWFERNAELIESLDAVTMRSTIDGRTFTWTMTLHTSFDDAFESLTRRIVAEMLEEAGDELLEAIGARRRGCAEAVDHMIYLTKSESPDDQVDAEAMREAMLGLCESGKFDPYCVLDAWNLEDANRCTKQ